MKFPNIQKENDSKAKLEEKRKKYKARIRTNKNLSVT